MSPPNTSRAQTSQFAASSDFAAPEEISLPHLKQEVTLLQQKLELVNNRNKLLTKLKTSLFGDLKVPTRSIPNASLRVPSEPTSPLTPIDTQPAPTNVSPKDRNEIVKESPSSDNKENSPNDADQQVEIVKIVKFNLHLSVTPDTRERFWENWSFPTSAHFNKRVPRPHLSNYAQRFWPELDGAAKARAKKYEGCAKYDLSELRHRYDRDLKEFRKLKFLKHSGKAMIMENPQYREDLPRSYQLFLKKFKRPGKEDRSLRSALCPCCKKPTFNFLRAGAHNKHMLKEHGFDRIDYMIPNPFLLKPFLLRLGSYLLTCPVCYESVKSRNKLNVIPLDKYLAHFIAKHGSTSACDHFDLSATEEECNAIIQRHRRLLHVLIKVDPYLLALVLGNRSKGAK